MPRRNRNARRGGRRELSPLAADLQPPKRPVIHVPPRREPWTFRR